MCSVHSRQLYGPRRNSVTGWHCSTAREEMQRQAGCLGVNQTTYVHGMMQWLLLLQVNSVPEMYRISANGSAQC